MPRVKKWLDAAQDVQQQHIEVLKEENERKLPEVGEGKLWEEPRGSEEKGRDINKYLVKEKKIGCREVQGQSRGVDYVPHL